MGECQEVQVQWAPQATANSVRHLRCKLIRVHRKKDAKLNEEMKERLRDYKVETQSDEDTDRPQHLKLNMISDNGPAPSTALEVTLTLLLLTGAVAPVHSMLHHSFPPHIFIEFILLRLILVSSKCK